MGASGAPAGFTPGSFEERMERIGLEQFLSEIGMQQHAETLRELQQFPEFRYPEILLYSSPEEKEEMLGIPLEQGRWIGKVIDWGLRTYRGEPPSTIREEIEKVRDRIPHFESEKSSVCGKI